MMNVGMKTLLYKEIMKQMWRDLFFFHGIVSLPLFHLYKGAYMFRKGFSPGCAFFFFLGKMYKFIRVEIYTLNNHSICYFREHNYFSKVKTDLEKKCER